VTSSFDALQDYSLRWLGFHLNACDRLDVLRGILVTPEYLTSKSRKVGVNSIIEECEYFAPGDEIAAIGSALKMSTHILNEDPDQLPGQLVGRLRALTSPLISELIQKLTQGTPGDWLEPMDTSLFTPGPLIRTLRTKPHMTAAHIDVIGNRAIAASDNGSLFIWDLSSGVETGNINKNDDEYRSCVVVGDGARGILISSAGQIEAIDLASAESVVIKDAGETKEAAHDTAVSADGTFAVLGSLPRIKDTSNVIQFIDLKTGSVERAVETDKQRVLAVDHGCQVVLTADDSGKTITVWHNLMSIRAGTLHGHSEYVRKAVIAPSGKRACTAAKDGTVRAWDLDSYTEIQKFEGAESSVMQLAISHDGETIAIGSEDGCVYVLNIRGSEVARRVKAHDAEVTALALSPDADLLLSSANDMITRLWDVSKIPEEKLHGGRYDSPRDRGDAGYYWTLSNDGKYVMQLSVARDLTIYNVRDRAEIFTVAGPVDRWCPVERPQGFFLIVSRKDNQLRYLDAVSGRVEDVIELGADSVSALSSDTAGRLAAIGTSNGSIYLWDLNTGRLEMLFRGPGPEKFESGSVFIESIAEIALSGFGRLVAIGRNDGLIRVWDVLHKAPIFVFRGKGLVEDLAFTGDNKRLISAHGRRLSVWDLSGKADHFEFSSDIYDTTTDRFITTRDGTSVLASGVGSLSLWNLKNRRAIHSLRLDRSLIDDLAQCEDDIFAFISYGEVHYVKWHRGL
jgi:WD40 repeat protein